MITMTIDEYHDMTAKQTVKRGKWNNVKTEVGGHKFDSKREAARYGELKLLEQAGEISDLIPHPQAFILQSGFRDNDGVWQKPIKYVADFSYMQDGRVVVEDVKGAQTDVFKIKKKLFLFKFPSIKFVITK